MKYKLSNEDQILDAGFRKQIIEEIIGTENVDRKMAELKKYEVYKDNTRKWVIDALNKEGLKPETVLQMSNRASNISICRKIVDKLSQLYVQGVTRRVDDEQSEQAINDLVKLMDVNTKQKKSERYLQLFKNTMTQVVPELCTDESTPEAPKYKIKLKPLAPFHYDVIEDLNDKEKARVVILTDFTERQNQARNSFVSENAGQVVGSGSQLYGDRKEQIIADSPEDDGQDKRTFIWWGDKYHFTTDCKGQVIPQLSPEDGLNPIGSLPFVNVAEDQDGDFWARGGEDLIDGSILINTLLTDMFSIANVQGWGQLVAIGKNLPQRLNVGPHNAILLEYDSGDPTPSLSFESANPPLETWMRMIEQLTALLLSTNNLSARAVASKLDASNFNPSGISLLIEQSENISDMQEKQQIFRDAEPEMWELIQAWYSYLFERDALEDEFKEVGLFQDAKVQLEFQSMKPVVTEAEKLQNIKLRKDLGINTMLELIMIDNPDLSPEEAEAKLKDLLFEKVKKAAEFAASQIKTQEQPVDQQAPKQQPPQTEMFQ